LHTSLSLLFNDTSITEIYTLSLHDALPILVLDRESGEFFLRARQTAFPGREIAELFGISGGRLAEQIDANILNLTGDQHRRLRRSEEHTSELQSLTNLVCRLLLAKKNRTPD